MRRTVTVLGAVLAAFVLAMGWLAISPTTLAGDEGSASLSVIAESAAPAEVAITVAGPYGYAAEFTGTQVLRNLAPGEYSVTATATVSATQDGSSAATAVPAAVTTTLTPLQHEAVTITTLPTRLVGGVEGQPTTQGYRLEADTIRGPARWNPCQPITWAPVTPLPPSEEPLLTAAFAEASAESGLTFQQVSPADDPAVQVDITMVNGDRVDGEGTIVYFPPTEATNPRATGGRLEAAIGDDTPLALRIALYLHEIGHVIGLGHVDDPAQVMYPTLEESDGDGFAAGDRAGLRALGAAAGCLTNPLPAQDASASVRATSGTPRTLDVRWFQPASDPPVTSTSLRLITGTDDARSIQLLGLPALPSAGDLQAATAGAAQACEPGAQLILVSQNANGETDTPVTLTGCPR